MELKKLLEEIRVGEQTVLDVTATGGDRKLTVELRRLNPEAPRAPTRLESPARKHEFFSAESLRDYLADFGSEATVVYADPSAECVSAVLDELGSRGFEVVTMRPAPHPLWKPWADLVGKKLPLRAFAEFVAANRRAIVRPDGKAVTHALAQVRAAVAIETNHGRGKDSINGVLVRTKIQGVEQSGTVELPDEIALSVPLYVQTSPLELELDLCIESSKEGEVSVLVGCGTVSEARVAAFERMVEVIREGTRGINATVTFGRPQYAEWKYLRELPPAEAE